MTGWAFAQTVPAEPSASSAKPTESFPHRLLGDIQHEIANVLGAALWVGCWGLGIYYLDEHGRAILEFIRQLNP